MGSRQDQKSEEQDVNRFFAHMPSKTTLPPWSDCLRRKARHYHSLTAQEFRNLGMST